MNDADQIHQLIERDVDLAGIERDAEKAAPVEFRQYIRDIERREGPK